MNIAMISLYLPSETKMGVGYQAHAMANGFVARGHSVTMFSACAKPDGALYDYQRVDVGSSLRTFRFAWNLRKIDFSGFDVIHAHGDNYWLWSRRHRPPIIRTMHGSCLAEAWRVPAVKEKFRMLLLYGAEILATVVSDKTVCVSANTLKYYPGLKTVIPNGVDVAAFGPAAAVAARLQVTGDRLQGTVGLSPDGAGGGRELKVERLGADEVTGDGRGHFHHRGDGGKGGDFTDQRSRITDQKLPVGTQSLEPVTRNLSPVTWPGGKAPVPTILFVGTYGNRKRGKLLMEVFARDVLPKLPEAQLWMVCSDAPAAAGVCVLGRISQAELVERYQRAWVFCLPSTYEGFGIPYIEAMAAGTAVVASPNVGAVEVTRNGQDGLIATDDKLGEALVQVLADEVLRHKLEAAGRERVKDFDLSRVCEKYEEIYTELTKGE
jgi:glycosyltransferase involved in cell wall biosynthesis